MYSFVSYFLQLLNFQALLYQVFAFYKFSIFKDPFKKNSESTHRLFLKGYFQGKTILLRNTYFYSKRIFSHDLRPHLLKCQIFMKLGILLKINISSFLFLCKNPISYLSLSLCGDIYHRLCRRCWLYFISYVSVWIFLFTRMRVYICVCLCENNNIGFNTCPWDGCSSFIFASFLCQLKRKKAIKCCFQDPWHPCLSVLKYLSHFWYLHGATIQK